MTTTLNEARAVLIKLQNQFPAPSTYATQLAILSDYFDNQIPLLVENKSLHQRIQMLESIVDGVRKVIPSDPPAVPAMVPKKSDGIKCTRYVEPGCQCTVCTTLKVAHE